MATKKYDRVTLLKPLALVGAVALLTVLLLSVPQSYAAHINPTVIATIPVGTVPFGNGVNPTTNRVYVANDITFSPTVLGTVSL